MSGVSFAVGVVAIDPVPSGGTTGQVLAKKSDTDYDTEWVTGGGGGGGVTSVTGTAPIASSGGTTPAISISQATTSTDGYVSSTDWNTFNNKQAALTSGTNIKTINSTSVLGSGDLALFAGGLIQVKVVAALPGTPDANTLYIVTT